MEEMVAFQGFLLLRRGSVALPKWFFRWGGLGFHLQWDMALFCWIYDALVNPRDEFRKVHKVVNGLVGLAPGRAHALRGRVVFMESHDTAACDRYGRVPAGVHNGKSFLPEGAEDALRCKCDEFTYSIIFIIDICQNML